MTTTDVPLQGAPAAPPDENTSTGMDPGLPQGVHPLDRSVPHTPGTNPDHDTPISLTEPGPQGITRPAPWSTDNETALPVYQRSAHDWNVKVLSVNSTQGPMQAAGRLRGCEATTLSVPTTLSDGTTPKGVMFSSDEGELQQGLGAVLNPGDSVTIRSEGAVWVAVITNNTTGSVQVMRTYNPPGGGLGLSAT